MPAERLPFFKYHPDPLATESIKRSSETCVCCARARGYEYSGPRRRMKEDRDLCICPWCIADGSAHQKLGVHFHPGDYCGDDRRSVPQATRDEIELRTPGFFAWQDPQWWTHCGTAAEFRGRVGTEELLAAGPEAIAEFKKSDRVSDDDWNGYFDSLDRDGDCTAYLFRCTKCGRLGGFTDAN